MKEFELENKNGSMFVEVRTDGGIGIYYDLSKECKSVAFQMSKDEMIKMTAWLVTYIESQK